MADSASESDAPDPFSVSEESGAPPWEEESSEWQGSTSDGDDLPAFASDMARLWVRRHQKATMLGAFAVGVFIGAMFRD